MKVVSFSKQFRKDLKRVKRRRKDIDALEAVVTKLRLGKPLEARFGRHPLKGKYRKYEECHIESDWLLIWKETKRRIYLVRTGSHSDLF